MGYFCPGEAPSSNTRSTRTHQISHSRTKNIGSRLLWNGCKTSGSSASERLRDGRELGPREPVHEQVTVTGHELQRSWEYPMNVYELTIQNSTTIIRFLVWVPQRWRCALKACWTYGILFYLYIYIHTCNTGRHLSLAHLQCKL